MAAKLATIVARGISLLCHPIWLPLLYVCIFFGNSESFANLIALVSLFLVIFPGIVALAWMYVRKDADWFNMSQSNRSIPLLGNILGLAFFAVANGAFLPDEVFLGELMAICLVSTFFALIITLYWKISIHMTGWGIVLALGSFSGNPILIAALILTCALVAWARWKVKAHDGYQLIAGLGLGCTIGLVSLLAFP